MKKYLLQTLLIMGIITVMDAILFLVPFFMQELEIKNLESLEIYYITVSYFIDFPMNIFKRITHFFIPGVIYAWIQFFFNIWLQANIVYFIIRGIQYLRKKKHTN